MSLRSVTATLLQLTRFRVNLSRLMCDILGSQGDYIEMVKICMVHELCVQKQSTVLLRKSDNDGRRSPRSLTLQRS